jgi:hypothetical protein
MSNQTPIAHAREFFTLAAAERAVAKYTPEQGARVRAYFDAAERRLAAARRITTASAAAPLLREAVVCYLHATEIARDGACGGEPVASGAPAAAMPELPPDPISPRSLPTDDTRVRAALAACDLLYFDRLSPEDAARTRTALDRAASMLRARVEVRSIANLRAARWRRFLALVVVVAYTAVTCIRAAIPPANVALHKPVIPSSVKSTPSDEQTIVDGEIGWSYGILTDTDDSPFVTIDLIDAYRVDRVHVHNRVDGWFDDCLPLVVELSTDGHQFNEIERRNQHFDAEPPWIVGAHGEPARYVRLRVARRGYLALSEVEVFGKKM